MRVGLTYNLKPEGASDDEFEEFDSIETVEGLERGLRAAGHEPVRLGWGAELLTTLTRENVDGVFNIAEGMGGRGRESQVPALCEMLGIPCSGSTPLAIGLTLDKAMAKLVAKAHGIATAPWQTIIPLPPGEGARRAGEGRRIRFPLFAKPSNEGSSMGITARSLCRDEAELRDAVDDLAKYGPVLIEEFLPGDEFTVGIVDGAVLAVMQVVPRATTGEPFIYSLEVKRDYTNRVDYRLVDAPDVADVALAVWRAFNLRDVARIDVRRDRDGIANFVEVNPLPGVHPVTSDLVIMARATGLTHEQLIGRIIASAERRWNRHGRLRWLPKAHSPFRPEGAFLPRGLPGVAYNDDADRKGHLNEIERLGELEVIETAHEIASIVGADLVPVRDDLAASLQQLRELDVVVDLCEGVAGNPRFEMHFALALEMLGLAHTSCDPIAVGACSDKLFVRKLLRAAGLPTPRTPEEGGAPPFIVKPSLEDAGSASTGPRSSPRRRLSMRESVTSSRPIGNRRSWRNSSTGES